VYLLSQLKAHHQSGTYTVILEPLWRKVARTVIDLTVNAITLQARARIPTYVSSRLVPLPCLLYRLLLHLDRADENTQSQESSGSAPMPTAISSAMASSTQPLVAPYDQLANHPSAAHMTATGAGRLQPSSSSPRVLSEPLPGSSRSSQHYRFENRGTFPFVANDRLSSTVGQRPAGVYAAAQTQNNRPHVRYSHLIDFCLVLHFPFTSFVSETLLMDNFCSDR
jgi:hypothetical protein